jgi:solute carrier family 25 phosphate transporter 3
MHGFKSYFPSSLYTPTAASAVADAKRGAAPFAAPVAGFAPSNFQHPAAGFMAASSQEYGIDYFLKGALAGGICCSVTHGALTPVDVVKTRMQLDPSKYTGMVSGFNKVIAEEGAGALLTGLGPTAFGYFVQGWFKFGGVEYFKIQAHNSMTPQQTWDNRNSIYLGASAAAEFIADIFLCPLEATRIRLVSNPTYASSMMGAMSKMAGEEGVIGAFYKASRRSEFTNPSAKPPRRARRVRTSPCPSRPVSSPV